MIEHDVNFLSAILILVASAVPIYLSLKLKKELKVLTSLLSVFLLSHAAYHLLCILGFEFVGEKVFEPLSVVTLIIFGVVYLRTKRQEIKI